MALPRAYGRSADTHRAARPPTRPKTPIVVDSRGVLGGSACYQATHDAGADVDFFTV